MKASTQRKLVRWIHLIIGIPVVGYIYGPVSQMHVPSMLVRWVFFPVLVLSGLFMWKGHLVIRMMKNLKKQEGSGG